MSTSVRTSSLPGRWGIEGVPVHDARWTLVERVTASSQLQKAPQLREILLYIAARTLTESPVSISEQQIGQLVLGRGRDFDPNLDNIVRVRIRHLRSKLEEYFAGEGIHEPLILTIPKGFYMARFEPRPPVPEEAKPPETKEPGGRSPAAATVLWRRDIRTWIALGSLLIAAVALVVAARNFGTARRAAPTVPALRADYAFYEELLGPLGSGETRLVLSNPKLMVYVGTSSRDGDVKAASKAIAVPPQLAAELAPATNRRDQGLPFHFIRITDQDYTGIGEADTCFYLGQLMQILGRQLELTQARFVNWDSARREDLIIVGSPENNEWTYENLAKHNFSTGKLGIYNEKPRPGQPNLYRVLRDPDSGSPLGDYGLIWMSRSASGNRVLVLAGGTSPGTAGVGSFFADPEKMRPVYQKLKADTAGRQFPSDWQVLLKVNIRDNLPIETGYVDHRVSEPAQ